MYTVDDFLGGLIHLKQPKKGVRATSDAVLLASCVPDDAKGTLLDVGCGSGILALSVAKRADGIEAVGVDIQEDLVALAKENAEINSLSDRVVFECTDVCKAGAMKGQMFDYVITNPPFYSESAEGTDMVFEKTLAHHEKNGDFLARWVDFSMKHLKPKGKFVMIHKAERLPDILALIGKRLGGVGVLPLYSAAGKAAIRVIVFGVMNSRAKMSILPPLIVHNDDGSFTEEAESILRNTKLF